jgi:hypothetical protein
MSPELQKVYTPSNLTLLKGGFYTRQEHRQGSDGNPGLLGHYGIAAWINPQVDPGTQLGSIYKAMRSHVISQEGNEPTEIRRVQMKLVVSTDQLQGVIDMLGAKNIEGIVDMTGGKYVYVLCGHTNLTTSQRETHGKTSTNAQQRMIQWAKENNPDLHVPKLGHLQGHMPESLEEVAPELESDAKVGRNAVIFTQHFLKSPESIRRSALQYALKRSRNPSSPMPPERTPDITREFDFSLFLKRDTDGKQLFSHSYFDQNTLKNDTDGSIRKKWVDGIMSIWGDKFGWDEKKTNAVLDQITSGENKSWICAVEHKGELISSALADVAIICDGEGNPIAAVAESNEWGVNLKRINELKKEGHAGFGATVVSLVNATIALRCIDERTGKPKGMMIDGKRLPTACYAEVNADPQFNAFLTGLRAQMVPVKNGVGDIGRMEGHVEVNVGVNGEHNGDLHGVFMIMQVPAEDTKGLVNGAGQNDMERLIGYNELRKTINGNIYTHKQSLRPSQVRMRVAHQRKRRAQKGH